MKEEKLDIKDQVFINDIVPSRFIKDVFYLYDKPTKTKPYIFLIEDKLFLTMKGTQTFEQVKQDFFSIHLKKISVIIDDFIKDYNPSDEYLELLIKIKDYYGKYEYGSGFFTPVLHVLFPILQYIKRVSFKELYIIGHSLGGAESSIFLMLFLYIQKLPGYDFKDIKLVTFGEPSGLKNNKNGQELVKKIQKEKI